MRNADLGAPSHVVGVFADRSEAMQAVEALRALGFAGDDVSIITPEGKSAMPEAHTTRGEEGTTAGAIVGGVLGGLGGWLVGVGALTLPVIGPVVATGVLAAALAGAGAGLGVGALAGGLIGLGIPEDEAHWYEQQVGTGWTLVAVRANGQRFVVRETLDRHGALTIAARDGDPGTRPVGGSAAHVGAEPERR